MKLGSGSSPLRCHAPLWSALQASGVIAVLLLSACKNDAGPVAAVDPERIYNQMCARCHGLDGKGEPEVMKSLPVRDLTAVEVQSRPTEALELVIMKGQNQMPPFGEVLTPRKIQAVVGHVKRLGQR